MARQHQAVNGKRGHELVVLVAQDSYPMELKHNTSLSCYKYKSHLGHEMAMVQEESRVTPF